MPSSPTSKVAIFPMIHPLPLQIMEQWTKSMEAAFKSMLQMAEFAAEVIDDATIKHINELTANLISGTRMFNPALAMRSASARPAVKKTKQRVAVVTGGCGGIGTEICRKLARNGCQVVSTYVAAEAEFAKQWQKERKGEGLDIDVAECNVTEFVSCERMAREIEQKYGGADILVNCAGITKDNTLRKMDEAHWHAVLDTNLDSVFNVTKQFIDGMTSRHFGRVINISSVNGQKGQFGQTNYSAAKAGMIGFTRSLARELADQGITVNTVSPGYVNTKMAMAVPEDVRNGIIAKIPVGRFAEPSEIAHAVAFLASDESGYITGSDLSINGGLFMM
ncbi:MAG: 3-phenylpropionate-dihydrodiol/cinnamic acid-dihydrodiol dehydrogenase [Gammaproteobacteria bacterium]|nr:3-phenylpropionate-dihydrodiol/cinnamic acid-dihydrodiol dehydrogenase [Gammaproteobacteria bacterium]